MTLDEPTADRLATIALGHVTREWPHALSHVLDGPEDIATPKTLHPIFYGSFDWHSCVHTYWLLATLHRRFPAMAQAGAITTLFDQHLTPTQVAGECAYFNRPAARGFERPYGWAWLLALQHALQGTEWATILRPLADIIAARFRTYLPKAQYPVRVGTHYNTAFALTLAAPYAAENDPALLAMLQSKAQDWYANDTFCQAWEPAQDDFLSPALTEAACMHRLAPDFLPWLDRFLPRIAARDPQTLFTPATISDRADGKIAHLDGLNLSRAWCWQLIAAALPNSDARHPPIRATVQAHQTASIDHVTGDFMGEHWLATFVVLALCPDAVAPPRASPTDNHGPVDGRPHYPLPSRPS